ncbi:hypothetical protein MKX01_004463 [Papaver californicum]|nr:hypothetical protein MKX01_004463 [Papaver californicum]
MKSWNTTGVCHGDKCRPRLVGFFDCKNVTLHAVELRIPAISKYVSHNIFISDSTLESQWYIPHNHGIHIEDSNNTFINNTIVDNGGNAITVKTIKGPVYNLTVVKSELVTKLSAIKFGSDGRFDFKGIVFNNINVYDSYRGITMQLHEGGMASDITFSNIKINSNYNGEWTTTKPIYITTCPQDSKSKTSNLRFSYKKESCKILQNLKFMNVNLTYQSTNLTDNAGVDNESAGIKMEYIDGLVIENMIMRWVDNASHLKSAWKNVNTFNFQPSTVNNVSIHSFSSSSE